MEAGGGGCGSMRASAGFLFPTLFFLVGGAFGFLVRCFNSGFSLFTFACHGSGYVLLCCLRFW